MKLVNYIFKSKVIYLNRALLVFLLSFALVGMVFGDAIDIGVHIDIASSKNGLSYNQIEQHSFDDKEIVIDNSDDDLDFNSAKIIIFEVVGKERSDLKGCIKVLGKKARLILINPNGIICNGCRFVNVEEVVLRVDHQEGISGDIYIGRDGFVVEAGSLMLSSGQINIEGELFANDVYIKCSEDINLAGVINSANNLKIQGKNIFVTALNLVESPSIFVEKAHLENETFNMVQIKSGGSMELEGDKICLHVSSKLKSEGEFLKLTGEVLGLGSLESMGSLSVLSSEDILLNSVYSHGDISLVASNNIVVSDFNAGKKGDLRLYGKTIDVKNVNEVDGLVIHAGKIVGDFAASNVENIEVVEERFGHGVDDRMDFNIVSPLEIGGNFKFKGRGFENHSIFKARNVELKLSDYFINDVDGRIKVERRWSADVKNFSNYHNMYIGEDFQIKGGVFVNDKGGYVEADTIEVYLTSKMDDGNSLYQGSDSVLKAHDFIELVAPLGGLYFGYKKEFTGEGDNKDGFELIGSLLSSGDGGINIQSGGDVIFDGVRSQGRVTVEAKGEIMANEVKGSYRDGVNTVFDRHVWRCPSGIEIFGGCVGGPKRVNINKQVPNIKQVVLQADFVGEKFSAHQGNLVFKILDQDEFKSDSTDFLEEMVRGHVELMVNVDAKMKIEGSSLEISHI